ncbi:MAG: hypothetical protein A3G80_06295 [Betaproteobacteria bacterium RIFCSPLOWO2_12_FULL_62_13b]|nr:MAG: hypothetical protein A3G80_06295 [Betaproteobacteria bacterium RIFCSPLOWO2_12_FULL_62_13b]
MREHWAEEFVCCVGKRGVPCDRVRHNNGWIETVDLANCRCFIKSVSYDERRRQYFLGVDPGKLSESGDAVVICGGRHRELSDIFVIPWKRFFAAIAHSEPINTYRDREYFQYKFYVRERDGKWIASFQGGSQPILQLTGMRFEPKDAVAHLRSMECRGNAR